MRTAKARAYIPTAYDPMKLRTILLLLLGVFALHFIALAAGIYDRQIEAGFVWFDNILHALIGVIMGLLFLWLVRRYDLRMAVPTVVTLPLFVLMAAIAWEVAEYVAFVLVAPLMTDLKIFSPSLMEASTDIASNILGAAALILALRLHDRHTKPLFTQKQD